MDMVLHNGYVRLLVEVVDGDGDVNKGEVGYCCLSLVMVCHLLMFVFFLFVVCLCLAFVVVFRLPLFVVRCCLLVVVISRLALFGACRLLLFVVCRCSRLSRWSRWSGLPGWLRWSWWSSWSMHMVYMIWKSNYREDLKCHACDYRTWESRAVFCLSRIRNIQFIICKKTQNRLR